MCMKRWKVYGCAAVFLLLTAVKMIAPAAASDARAVLVPAIGADDDYRAVFAEIRSAFSTAQVGEQDARLQPYLPEVDMSAWATPAPEPTPTPTPQPTPEPTPEPTQSPELQAAFAAREAGGLFRLCHPGERQLRGQRAAVCTRLSGRGLHLVRLRLPAAPAGKQGQISLRHRLRGQFRHDGLCLC